MIKVLVIDDSAVVRAAMTEIFEQTPDIRVVATAADPVFARDKLKTMTPDVITLDVEMPRMDGVTFLKKLMAFKPIPVVMVSSLTTAGAAATIDALAAGAVDFVSKPTGSVGYGLQDVASDIIQKVRAAANAKVRVRQPVSQLDVPTRHTIDEMLPLFGPSLGFRGPPVICIGASTGGTVAIESVLQNLQPPQVPIVIVQHMPPLYTSAFASRLNSLSALDIREAEHNMPLTPNSVSIAKGGIHMLIDRMGSQYHVVLKDAPPVNRHRPSVDMLFRSAANSAGAGALGIILTGMGDDGARGLRDLKNLGAFTFGQDENSCVVYGMPAAAKKLDAVHRELPLSQIPFLITQFSRRESTR